MHINEVKTAIKVGDFVLRKGSKNKISFQYSPNLNKKTLSDDSARIYLITQDGIIKKIGGSIQTGGIKGTISFYIGAMTGSPGRPRFIVHLLIEKALKSGSKVALYMITSPKTSAKVSGLFETKKMKIASFKEMEDLCKFDYYSKEKKYPDWNFQENHQPYPPELERKFMAYHRKRLSKK
ncbi:MAG TPA: hypothetical protein PK119_00550 [Candidatus Paceibacterota bacterium]|nr:hypothetical protein [Candidatus Paceibacterota bacterium]